MFLKAPSHVAILSLVLVSPLAAQEGAPTKEPPSKAPDAATASDAPPTVSSLKLDLAKLKAWGTRVYEYRLQEGGEWKTLGKCSMKTEVADDRITLSDSFDLEIEGAPFEVDTKVSGPLTGCLRPDSIEAEGTTDDRDGKKFKSTATLDAKGMNTGKREKSVPEEAVTDAGLYRLLTLMPARDGFSARFDGIIEVSELMVKGGSVIRYEGKSQPPEAKEGASLDKFSVASATDRGDPWLQVWLDAKGQLDQALLDGRKLLVAVK
jgi:hypothetical protein